MHFISAYTNRSLFLDSLIVYVMENNLLTGGVLMALFWWTWFTPTNAGLEKREVLLFGLLLSILAVFIARALALALPFRLRPLQDALVHFKAPYKVDATGLINWSSFPSDHAVLFFGIAAAVWMVSRPVGAVALCHTLFIINLPRVYAGIHYPSDIIAGAVLGIGIVSLCRLKGLRKSVTHIPLSWLDKHPSSFYAVLFLLTFETTEVFDSTRQIAIHAFHFLRGN